MSKNMWTEMNMVCCETRKSPTSLSRKRRTPGREVQLKDRMPCWGAKMSYCREMKGNYWQGWNSQKQHEISVFSVSLGLGK